MFVVVPANQAHLSEILAWLEREYLDANEGFYCNKSIIIESLANGELSCALFQGQPVGFVIHTLKSVGSAIDILEIHPAHRGQGFGTHLARHAISRLFSAGATFVTVKCAPRSSEPFWRALGFTPAGQRVPSVSEPPQLILRNAA